MLHEPYMKAFEALKRAGKIRFTGIATHRNEPAVIRAVVKSGFWDVVLTAYNFRQSHREEVRAAIREAAAAGVGVLAMKTQAGVYWDPFRLRKINMKAALKWVLQDEHVCSTVPAFANHDELNEDLAVMRDPALTPDEERDLRFGGLLGHSGLYCQQCAQCIGQCPAQGGSAAVDAELHVRRRLRRAPASPRYARRPSAQATSPARAVRSAGCAARSGSTCARGLGR